MRSGSRTAKACSLKVVGVGVDLGAVQLGAGGGAPAGVPYTRGVVAHDEHDRVAQVLELAQLAQHDRVPEVDVGCGGIDAELGAQRPPLGQLLLEPPLGERIDGIAGEEAGCVTRAIRHGANARLPPRRPGGPEAAARGFSKAPQRNPPQGPR